MYSGLKLWYNNTIRNFKGVHMSAYGDKILSKFMPIGKFVIRNNKFEFETNYRKSSGQINRKHFVELGDIVYAMFTQGKLVKIGKAAGMQGWYGRCNEYCKPEKMWDRTTRKMYNWMIKNNETEITIVAIQSPRIETTITSPITQNKYTKMIETAGELEQELIQEAYRFGEELAFCKEIAK